MPEQEGKGPRRGEMGGDDGLRDWRDKWWREAAAAVTRSRAAVREKGKEKGNTAYAQSTAV
jgi:hypothetical protein